MAPLLLLLVASAHFLNSVTGQSDSGESAEVTDDSATHRLRLHVTPRTVGHVASGAEAEPVMVWATPSTSSGTVEETGTPKTADRQLERILERLTTIEGLQVQTLRRIEGLDYRLTRVEVQVQERGETIRNSAAEAGRRLQTVEAEIGRVETLLDVVRDETTHIRTAQTEFKSILLSYVPHSASRGASTGGASAKEVEIQAPRLQVLMAGVNHLRAMTNGMREELSTLVNNVTLITNLTKGIERRVNVELISKQDLHKSLAATLSPDSQPPRSLPLSCPYQPQAERPIYPRDCSELINFGTKKSGIQQIQPLSSTVPFFVQCDMETREGGWTVIHNRQDGSVNFLREWGDFKNGFGNLATEFWLGLEKIHMLTNQGVYELLIELTDFDLHQATAQYSAFAIGTESEGYDLRLLGTYEGDAGDSLTYHVSMKFSTVDVDNDMWVDGSCARSHVGGWWYRSCDTSNLNGQYLNGNLPSEFEYKGMYWYDYRGPLYSLLRAKMMIRPAGSHLSVQTTTTAKPKVPAKGNKAKKKKEDDE